MFWIIRWTDVQGQDQSLVVEAHSQAVAEAFAIKRDIPVVVIGEASRDDIAEAEKAKRLWRSTYGHRRYTCFGRPVPPSQLACLMTCGVCTITVLLRLL
jgi:hypothetical protein